MWTWLFGMAFGLLIGLCALAFVESRRFGTDLSKAPTGAVHQTEWSSPGSPGPELAAPASSPTPKPSPPNSKRDMARLQLKYLGLEPSEAALAAAAREGNIFTVDLFLNAGAPPDATDAAGTPALVYACDPSRLPVALRLLEAGADPNRAARDGRTPLMAAALAGNVPLMEQLVMRGALLDRADDHGHFALHFAVFGQSVPAVQWLIAKGAPAEGRCCGAAGSLLEHAVETGNRAILEPVIQSVRPERWSRATREALFAALRRRDKPMIQLLLKNHRTPPTLEGYRQPLLAYTVAWGNPAALRLLLECGADANTPVGSPVELPFAKLIPEEVTRYYLQTETGMTPLMVAAGLGRLDCVQALLKYGAKRGAVTGKSKFAAISFAARTNRLEIMQVLLGKSPRPEDQKTRVEISLTSQRAVLWKNNEVAAVAPISTGKIGFPTPSGRFIVTDKERVRHSTIYNVDMPYFMRLNCSEFGMHAGDVPDYPASHGCIRLPLEAAIMFYNAVDEGTMVDIDP